MEEKYELKKKWTKWVNLFIAYLLYYKNETIKKISGIFEF